MNGPVARQPKGKGKGKTGSGMSQNALSASTYCTIVNSPKPSNETVEQKTQTAPESKEELEQERQRNERVQQVSNHLL